MSSKTLEKKIDGDLYRTIPFGGRAQLEMLPGVMRLVQGPIVTLIDAVGGAAGPIAKLAKSFDDAKAKGQGVGQVLNAADLQDVLATLKAQALSTGVLGLADQMENGGIELIYALLENTFKYQGKTIKSGLAKCGEDFDTVFQNRTLTLGKVLFWILEVNYAPFLPSGIKKSMAVETLASED